MVARTLGRDFGRLCTNESSPFSPIRHSARDGRVEFLRWRWWWRCSCRRTRTPVVATPVVVVVMVVVVVVALGKSTHRATSHFVLDVLAHGYLYFRTVRRGSVGRPRHAAQSADQLFPDPHCRVLASWLCRVGKLTKLAECWL